MSTSTFSAYSSYSMDNASPTFPSSPSELSISSVALEETDMTLRVNCLHYCFWLVQITYFLWSLLYKIWRIFHYRWLSRNTHILYCGIHCLHNLLKFIKPNSSSRYLLCYWEYKLFFPIWSWWFNFHHCGLWANIHSLSQSIHCLHSHFWFVSPHWFSCHLLFHVSGSPVSTSSSGELSSTTFVSGQTASFHGKANCLHYYFWFVHFPRLYRALSSPS